MGFFIFFILIFYLQPVQEILKEQALQMSDRKTQFNPILFKMLIIQMVCQSLGF